jgi:uncharacterized membrane protein YdjX (TVP38/TMEM64 family)
VRWEPRWTRRAVVALVAVGVAIGLFMSPIDFVRVINRTGSDVAFLLLVLVLYLVRPLVLGPMSLLTVAVGVRFGPVVGLPVALAGTVVTTLPPYFIARSIVTDTGVLGRLANIGRQATEVTGSTRAVVAARLSPAPADAVSYGAGVANVPLRSYAGGTVLGEVPWALLYLLVGDSLRRVSTESVAIDIRTLAVFGVAAALLVVPPVYRHLAPAG